MTGLMSAQDMLKYLENCNLENPMALLERAVQSRSSVKVPKLKATLHWVYTGAEWSFNGTNSTDVNNYSFQLMTRPIKRS